MELVGCGVQLWDLVANFKEEKEVRLYDVYTKGNLFINKWNAGSPKSLLWRVVRMTEGRVYMALWGAGILHGTPAASPNYNRCDLWAGCRLGRLRNCTRFDSCSDAWHGWLAGLDSTSLALKRVKDAHNHTLQHNQNFSLRLIQLSFYSYELVQTVSGM